jgi:hypothetical protein
MQTLGREAGARSGGTDDSAAANLARRQHGVVSRRQLERLGFGTRAIEHRMKAGRLYPVQRGVYAVGHLALTLRSRWMAAVLASGPEAVLSHRTAAALWGIRDPGSGRIDVTAPRKTRSTERICRHFAELPNDERAVLDGIPVTAVNRTLLDLATVAKPHSVEAALREAEYLQLRDRLSLPALLARYPRHRGARSIRAALERRQKDPGGRIRSPLEELFLPFLDRHGLPRPRVNAGVHVPATPHEPERRYEVDCLWEDQTLIVELDGFESHRSRTAFESDRERDRRLTSLGYRVTRITKRQLLGSQAALAADLHHLLMFYKRP